MLREDLDTRHCMFREDLDTRHFMLREDLDKTELNVIGRQTFKKKFLAVVEACNPVF